MQALISVILPVYNGESYLKEAIDSILNQTFSDFELLVYNDGSTDRSSEILLQYNDSRIKIVNFQKNVGLIVLLNKAFSEAKGTYIARMDADDISMPERFKEQVQFLDQHPEHGICGTQISLIGSNELLKKPCTDEELRWWIFKGSPLAHPSIMMRASVLKDHNLSFNTNAYVVEDFDLWWRMAFHCKMANLDKVLLQYRIHEQQESSAKIAIQTANHKLSLLEFMKTLDFDTNAYSPGYMDQLLSRNLEFTSANFIKLWKLFKGLIQSGSAIKFFGIDSIHNQFESQSVFMLQNLNQYTYHLLPYLTKIEFRKMLQKAGVSISIFTIKSLMQWKTR